VYEALRYQYIGLELLRHISHISVEKEGKGVSEELSCASNSTSQQQPQQQQQQQHARGSSVRRYAPPPPTLSALRAAGDARNARYLESLGAGEAMQLPTPEVLYSGAVYSRPEDVPREPVRFAGRVFPVSCTHKSFLREFVSALPPADESATRGGGARSTVAAASAPSAAQQPHLQQHDGEVDGAGRGVWIYRPLRAAPTPHATLRWLRAQVSGRKLPVDLACLKLLVYAGLGH
jgi:hypothetical protein